MKTSVSFLMHVTRTSLSWPVAVWMWIFGSFSPENGADADDFMAWSIFFSMGVTGSSSIFGPTTTPAILRAPRSCIVPAFICFSVMKFSVL